MYPLYNFNSLNRITGIQIFAVCLASKIFIFFTLNYGHLKFIPLEKRIHLPQDSIDKNINSTKNTTMLE